MAWQLRDSVYYRPGTIKGNKIAAFDFDNTLAWSDSGLIFMRTENDWVPVVNRGNLVDLFYYLTRNDWTIVIFTNQLETNPDFTRKALARITNFLEDAITILRYYPYIYISIRDDEYRKPQRGMWDLFLADTKINPSEASFYCGDALGPQATNPLYQWGTFDSEFATNIGLAFYTPDEIFEPEKDVSANAVLLVMAAHRSHYQQFVTDLFAKDPLFTRSSLEAVPHVLAQVRKAIVTGERFATQAGRRRVYHIIPGNYHDSTCFIMFTRPIKPFVDDDIFKRDDLRIRGYANALDIHPKTNSIVYPIGREPFEIIRIN